MARRFDSYRLSRRAELDLEDIFDHTVTHWSFEQANRYISDIRAALAGLVEGIKIGRKRPDVAKGYLCYLVGAHLIIYRVEDEIVRVVRVLHASMDIPRHLAP